LGAKPERFNETNTRSGKTTSSPDSHTKSTNDFHEKKSQQQFRQPSNNPYA